MDESDPIFGINTCYFKSPFPKSLPLLSGTSRSPKKSLYFHYFQNEKKKIHTNDTYRLISYF